MRRELKHPPLQGEGRTAIGGPGWGEGRATNTMPKLRHGRHPHLVCLRKPTSPLQGEVKRALQFATSLPNAIS